jgi:hypothetical protein
VTAYSSKLGRPYVATGGADAFDVQARDPSQQRLPATTDAPGLERNEPARECGQALQSTAKLTRQAADRNEGPICPTCLTHCLLSQTCGPGQVDEKAVAPALVATSHLGGVAEIMLNDALLGLGGRRQCPFSFRISKLPLRLH